MAVDEPVRGDRIKSAINSLDVFGISLTQAIVEYLESHGNALDDKRSYSLKEVESELANIFGEDAAKLITHLIRQALNNP